MPDGRAKNGGARPGAGRKKKSAEEELQRLIKKCWTKEQREEAFKKLGERAALGSMEAIKFLTSYLVGKPTEISRDKTPDDKPAGYVVLTLDEWKALAAQRLQQADAAMKPFAEDGDAT